MEEFVVTNDELKKLFKDKKLVDTDKGWFYEDKEVLISAIHKVEPKYLLDKANSQNYRITPKNN